MINREILAVALIKYQNMHINSKYLEENNSLRDISVLNHP